MQGDFGLARGETRPLNQIVGVCHPEIRDHLENAWKSACHTNIIAERAIGGCTPWAWTHGAWAATVSFMASARDLPKFNDPMCNQVWAAVMTLDLPSQFQLLRELAGRFALTTGNATTRGDRIRKAIADLHTVADIYAHTPSVGEYRTLRSRFPELGLAPDGTIRRWLGGSWNDCLRLAFLDTASDGDFAARPSGTNKFTLEELIAAAQACARDLGHGPSMPEFFHWVLRPDVQARPGRRPRSYQPFKNFGGFPAVLVAAGVRHDDGDDRAPRPSGTSYRFSRIELFEAVREAASDLGRPPSMPEFFQWVKRPNVLARPGRRPRSYHPFERLGGFQAVLVAAGVIREGEARYGTDGRLLPLRYAYTREDMTRALAEVAARVGGQLTSSGYTRERTKMHDESRKSGDLVSLPSADTIRDHFGTWKLALEAAELPSIAARVPPFTGSRRPSYTHNQKIEWLQRAWVELGEPFTIGAYITWRRGRAAGGLDPGPSPSCLTDTFGNWTDATAQVRPPTERQLRRLRRTSE
jgi:hypothetical protein